MNESPFPKARLVEFADAGKDKFNELLCARAFARKVKLRTQGDRWYVWNGTAWSPSQRDAYRATALAILPQQNRCARHARSVMDHAEMAAQMGPEETMRGAVAFDEDGATLVNCANGVLRISEDDILLGSHREDLNFSGCIQATWDEEAEAPEFFRVLMEALPETDDLALLQWFSGYLLFPDCKQHEVFLICHGPGGTGKSTVSEAIINAIGGSPLVTALSMAQICAGEKAYSLPQLEHALVNLGTELDTVEVADSANFKKLVSGEVIEARTIYGRPFPMSPGAKLWFNSNDLPRFRHGTDAELRRARFLCFDRKPEKADKRLKEKLKGERDGIFRWMVQGLQAIHQGVACPEGSAKSSGVKGQFAVSNDPVRAFFEERLVRDPEGEVTKADVADEFRNFMDHRGFPPKAIEQLFRGLYQRFPFIRPARRRGDTPGERERVLTGISLREDE